MKKQEILIIGLGKIGSALVRNFCSKNFFVYGFDIKKNSVDNLSRNFHRASSIAQLISLTKTPRLIFLVLPSGKANLHTVNRLCSLIQQKDTVIDMSNSFFKRAEDFEKKYSLQGKIYIDVGISGGIQGAEKGPSLMVGNKKNISKNLYQVLEKISAKNHGKPCVGYYENPGNGHFVKMLHNFLEYSEMQLIAETVNCLSKVYESDDNQILDFINQLLKSDKNSFLLRITKKIIQNQLFRESDQTKNNPIKHNGTAKWAAQLSLEIETYTPSLFCALLERISLSKNRSSLINVKRKNSKKIKLTTSKKSNLILSYTVCRSSIYLQLLNMIDEINNKLNYNLEPSVISSNWRNGSIVKSDFLKLLSKDKRYYYTSSQTRLSENFNRAFAEVLSDTTIKSMTIPVMYSSWQYLQNYESQLSIGEIVGQQRLIFGGHKRSELNKLNP